MNLILQAIIEGLKFAGIMTLTTAAIIKNPVTAGIAFAAWMLVYVVAYLLKINADKKAEVKAESDKTRKIFIKSMLNSIVDNLADICHNVAIEYKGAEDFKITFRFEETTRTAIEKVVLPAPGHYTSEDMQELINKNLEIAKHTIGLD